MLTAKRSVMYRVAALVCTVTTCLAIVAAPSPASAANGCPDGQTRTYLGQGQYSSCVPVTVTQPGTPPSDGGNGEVVAPTCPLEDYDNSYDAGKPGRTPNYCIGTSVCYTVDVFPPWANPPGDKPKEDSVARMTFCFTLVDGAPSLRRVFWSDDEEPPTLLEQAQTAVGQINLATPTVNLNPATRTLVNLDTWIWLTGVERETTGSSAFGLVAIATLRTLSVNPGDGTGEFTCDQVATSAAEAQQSCHHTYRRSSRASSAAQVDGRPAYSLTANTVYGLRFEVNGRPVTIDGAPATLDGPPATAAVRVDEVQSIVTAG